MLRIFCKIVSIFTIILLHPHISRRNILCADGISVLGYDIMILSDLLHFSTSHDALISSIQMLLAKLESARIYVSVSLFAGVPSLPCKLKEITTIRQVLTWEMKSATLLSRRVKKQGYRSQKSSIKASKISGWVEQHEVVIFNSHVVQVPSCMHRSNCQPEWACQWLAKHRRQRDC